MSIYRVTNFSDGPHGDYALIEAESEAEARAILTRLIADEEADVLSWVDALPEADWNVLEAVRPLVYVLSSACR